MKRCPTCKAWYSDADVRCSIDGASLDTPADPLLGYIIEDRYRLDSIIGRGGFGTVYRAAHQRLPRDFAVKVLLARRADEPRHLARFKQEVRACAVLEHPHVLEVIDFGHDAVAGYFVVMPLLQGETLLERMQRMGQVPIVEILPILLQTASALQAAHDLGIVHRDIKPENIFLAAEPTAPQGFSVKLLDFGIAKVMLGSGDARLLESSRAIIEHMQAVGTCLTMSPEQVRGEEVDARADIYGLGCLAFELLTAELPYLSQDNGNMMRQHVEDPVQRPSERLHGHWIPESVDELLGRMMAKRREDRPQTMDEVIQEWEAVRGDAEEAWADYHLVEHGLAGRERLGDTGERRASTRTLAETPRNHPTDASHPPPTPCPAKAGIALPHALVVDDDVSIRNLVRLILQNAGWTCSTVDGGHAALNWLTGHPAPAAVVLDMLMPGLDGMAVLQRMREQGYGGPVVVCTSLQSEAMRAEAEAQAGVRFVTKGRELHTIPIVLSELRAVL